MLVVDAVLALDLQVGRVGADDVLCLDARNVVDVHVGGHGNLQEGGVDGPMIDALDV
jgi:hypothetical protein